MHRITGERPFDYDLFETGLNDWTCEGAPLGEKFGRGKLADQLRSYPDRERCDIDFISLDLSQYPLKSLPEAITHLIHLESLNPPRILSSPSYTLIGRMCWLTHLHLPERNLKEFPNQLTLLIYLRFLDISRNQLERLPKKIGQLTNLIELDASANKLKRLPKEMNNLTQMVTLELWGNKLQSLPNLSNMTQLERLELSANDLIWVPTWIGQLTNLTELCLGSNRKIFCLPNEIGQLGQLRMLELQTNENLTSLPSEIGLLQNLTYLPLVGCGLESLPEEIFNLPNQTAIDILDCRFLDNAEIVNNLKTRVKADNYQGPIIFDRTRRFRLPPSDLVTDMEMELEEAGSVESEGIRSDIEDVPDDSWARDFPEDFPPEN
jgi:Leucine-rich repeat (LRR) protein